LSIFFAIGKFSKPQVLSFSLEDRINPNVAPAASLVRLHGIGIVKARQIELYRQQVSSFGTDTKAFKNVTDLDKVSGIGPKTVQNMRNFLKFE
jgi:competence protein ComEA